MSKPMNTPLFAISNRHAIADNGKEPPRFDGDEPHTYHSYFENIHGDQSLFVYRRDADEAFIYSGDAGWTAFPVVEGKTQGLVLSPDEEIWLQACQRAIGRAR